jgi:hypothetical protein
MKFNDLQHFISVLDFGLPWHLGRFWSTSREMPMHEGRLIFAYLMDFIPWPSLRVLLGPVLFQRISAAFRLLAEHLPQQGPANRTPETRPFLGECDLRSNAPDGWCVGKITHCLVSLDRNFACTHTGFNHVCAHAVSAE